MVARVSLLNFLWIRKVFVDIVDCDEGPCQVVAVADAFETCGFGGKTSSDVEIPDCALDIGKLIDAMNGL